MAEHITKPLGELLAYMDREQLVLPEIQRDFIWDRRSVLKLFDSMYRGMPIGHMLVWKARQAVQTKGFGNRRPPKSPHELDGFFGYLLDGQQRLTAVSRVRDADEDFPLQFCVAPEQRDGEAVFTWKTPRTRNAVWFKTVEELMDPRFKIIQYLDVLRREHGVPDEKAEALRKEVERIQSILKYDIGVTIFESEDYREATELFVRFNSTGRRLKKADLIMAELSNAVPGLRGAEFASLRSRYREFPFTAPFLVQCLLALQTLRLSTKIRDPWGQFTEKDIRTGWRHIEAAVGQVVSFLTGTVGWKKLSSLPSINALIPLIFVVARGASFGHSEREVARRWLHLTTTRFLFSGAANTTLDRLIRKCAARPSVKTLWNATPKASLRPLKAADFQASRISGPSMAVMAPMFSANGARDWKDLDRKLDGSVVGKNAQLQVHHFFPRALLLKHGRTGDWINTLGNYTLLSAETNLNVGTEEPATYMERLSVSDDQLRAQAIPRDRDLWRVAKYEKFILEREKLLAVQANEYLGA